MRIGISSMQAFILRSKSQLRWIRCFAAVLIAFILCQPISMPVQAVTADDWYAVSGTFMQDGGSQYNNGKLQLLSLDDGCVLFECDVMQGSEADDIAMDFRLAGTFYVEEDGTGTWEEETEDGMVSLQFVLQDDKVTLEQTGTLPIPVEGTYTWLEENLEVTEECAGELLEGLSTAATSLTSYNRPYHLVMSNMVVDGWFYDMKAIFTPTGEVIGEFLIATDLSAVYRIDTETPALIFGSADAMMEAVCDVPMNEGDDSATVSRAEGDEAGAEVGDGLLYSVPLVNAVPSSGSLALGEKGKVVAVTPGNLPATVICTSENPEVATVDSDGVINGIAPGVAVINGTISLDGAEKAFSFEIDVWSKAIQPLDIRTSIPVGESVMMRAQAIGVSDPIRWSVTDTDLADIDAETGIFKGKKEGRLLMIAQAGDLRREWTITVGSVSSSVANESTQELHLALPLTIVAAAFAIGLAIFVMNRRKLKSLKQQKD